MSSDTGGSSEEPPVSDSSLDTMLSAAIAAVESTSDENNENSSDISEDTRQGLASDFTDSSEGEVTVEPGAMGPGPSLQHQEVAAEPPLQELAPPEAPTAGRQVGAAHPPLPPQRIWGR